MPETGAARRMPSAERRQQLLQVARQLFAQRGFDGVTTREIALAAGVNETIIFRQFAHKEDLYAAVLAEQANQATAEAWFDELRAYASRQDDVGLLRAVTMTILHYHRAHPDFLRLLFFAALARPDLAQRLIDQHVRPLSEFLAVYIAQRQREGALRPADPRVVVRALLGMPSYHAIVKGLFGAQELPLTDEQVATAFTPLLLEGLRPVPSPPVRTTPGLTGTSAG